MTTSKPPLTAVELDRMTPAEINAEWPRVEALLSGRPVPGVRLTPEELRDIDNLPPSRLDPETVRLSWDDIVGELRRRGDPDAAAFAALPTDQQEPTR